MSSNPKDIRAELDSLSRAAHAEMTRLGSEFQASIKALTTALAHRPDELQRRVDDAVRRFERNMAEAADAMKVALEARFGHPPSGPHKAPYVERFPPRTRGPRGGKRPSAGGILVTPDRPKGLSGGSAAPLEFDRD